MAHIRNEGDLRYDQDLDAAQHFVKGAFGAELFGGFISDLFTDVYEAINIIPGGHYILQDPFRPSPNAPSIYVWGSAHEGAEIVSQEGIQGLKQRFPLWPSESSTDK